MPDNKNVILQLHKGVSSEDKAQFLEELKKKGAKVVKDENIDSPIMPFVVVAVDGDHFSELQSAGLQGHAVVKHAEEDGTMHTM